MNFEQKHIVMGVLVVIALGLIYYYYTSTEPFTEGKSNNFELTQSDMPIHPLKYEPELGLITAASDFVGLPSTIMPPWGENINDYGKSEILDDGAMGNAGFGFNMCSKSCCSPQYPPPFALPTDDLVAKSKSKFVPSSYACNNGWDNNDIRETSP